MIILIYKILQITDAEETEIYTETTQRASQSRYLLIIGSLYTGLSMQIYFCL